MSDLKDKTKEGFKKTFFDQGLDWEADRQSRIEKSERRAWFVAIATSIIAVVAVIGIATLAPFKRVVPYVFAIDKATGNVEVVSVADDRAVVGHQEILDKHWSQRYVIARESYNYQLLQSDYDTVLSLSSEESGREYAKVYEGPNARDKKYGPGIEMRVKVLSVALTHDDVGTKAVVRFEKSVRHVEASVAEEPQYFVATFAYKYKPTMFGKEKDLIQNPLGFVVTSYRVDSEIAPVSQPPSAVK